MSNSMHRSYVDHISREVESIRTLIKELQSLTRNFDNYDFEHTAMEEIARHLEYADFSLEKLRNAV